MKPCSVWRSIVTAPLLAVVVGCAGGERRPRDDDPWRDARLAHLEGTVERVVVDHGGGGAYVESFLHVADRPRAIRLDLTSVPAGLDHGAIVAVDGLLATTGDMLAVGQARVIAAAGPDV